MGATKTSNLPFALELARLGWRIHPLRPGEKTPILKAWPERATADEVEITEFWRQYPDAGIGVACGKASNLVVIDVDSPKGGDPSILELMKRYGPLPDTMTSKTGGGGKQLFYRYPDGKDIRNKAKLDHLPGVDVRGEGGYVVAPPTIHPSGNAYEWINGTGNIADLPAAWVDLLTPAERPVDAAPQEPGTRAKLRNRTMQFIACGCEEGERNSRLHEAGTELAGAGYSIEEAREKLWLGAKACSPPIERDEFDATVTSCFSKPRSPWVDPNDREIGTNHYGGGVAPPQATTKSAEPPAAKHLPTISNIQIVNGAEEEKITLARNIVDIAAAVREATGGDPRVVQTALFALGDYDENAIPGKSAIRFIADDASLFAWLHERTIVHWLVAGGKKGARNAKRQDAAMTPVRRRELFEHLLADTRTLYAALEVLPHEPPVHGVFYVPFNLPTGNGEALGEWIERFNADEEEDKLLALSALLTPAWGGPCGSRPAFIFASNHGIGTGKTKSVERICQIYGGRISIAPDKEDWREAKSRLLSDESLAARCVMIDNVRHKLSGSELESLITSPVIDGKKMYVGQFSRPNRLTYYLTANSPTLSQDLADRAVMIRVGPPRHGSDWEAWSLRFVETNRLAILADIYTALKGPTVCEIAPENRDRWSLWQDSILARIPGGNELAAMIKARRPEADADLDEAEEIRQAIETELAQCGHNVACENVVIQTGRMAAILRRHGVMDDGMSKRGVTTRLQNLANPRGPLARLKRNPCKTGGRSWIYLGDLGIDDGDKVDIRENPSRD